jgi:solute carrier family 29 (equilibrative nucleoside transporter), member 1/2/3
VETSSAEGSKGEFQGKLVFQRIWPLAASLIITFATTLAVFPAVASSVRSLSSADGSLLTNDLFLPVACFLIVNSSDMAGRLSHGFLLFPNPQQGLLTLTISVMRIGLIPMFLFCNAQPRHHLTVVFGDAVYVVLLAIMAFSNGYLGNLGMMYGPKLVPPQFAETTGSIMALCLNTGLLLGSALSFAFIYAI